MLVYLDSGLERLARLARINSQLLQDQVQGSRLRRREEEWRLGQTQGRGRVVRHAALRRLRARHVVVKLASRLVLFCGHW